MKSTLVAQPETVSLSAQRGFEREPSGDGRRTRAGAAKPSAATRVSSIILVGTSFKTSSLAFREALARRLSRESARLPRLLGVKEYAQLVTCNRIEVLMAADSMEAVERALLGWLSRTPGMKPSSIYVHEDVDAIAHLFRVASGLDSMVIGEEQILSQVKDAGIAARTSRSSRGHPLRGLRRLRERR